MGVNKTYRIAGLMSGTSMDGLDMVLCEFNDHNQIWSFNILAHSNIPYDHHLRELLNNAFRSTSTELIKTDHLYGRWLGQKCLEFIGRYPYSPELIASHGHTIFHNPREGFSFQIGNGNDIAAVTGLPVVYDFRSLDVSLGGQGAPLVPAGDRLLFSEYDSCINLGGFSNISFSAKGEVIAYDICPVNIVLNSISRQIGEDFDKDGKMGMSGSINTSLLNELDSLSWYQVGYPKSLGREFTESVVLPIIENYSIPIADKLRTFYEHIADKIAGAILNSGAQKVLLTGGGAKNQFLTGLIKDKRVAEIVVPEAVIVDYKEAVIFAFLGLLRKLGINNCLASATGAMADSCCGVLVKPPA